MWTANTSTTVVSDILCILIYRSISGPLLVGTQGSLPEIVVYYCHNPVGIEGYTCESYIRTRLQWVKRSFSN